MAESDDESDDDHAEQNGSGHQAFPLHHFTFILFIMAVAVVVRFIIATISSRHYHPPFTVVMGIAGFAAGMIQELAGGKQGLWGDSVEAWYRVGPEFILFVLLPPLLFESAFGMKFHVFAKQAKAAIVLAGPGVLLSTALTGSFAVLLYGQTDKDFDWPAAMLLGSILSATDPVAVVAVLHTLGAPDKLSHLIEGESLLNDGSAYVVFAIFKVFAGGKSMTAGEIVGRFLQLSLGGPLWGYSVALVCSYVMRLQASHDDALVEITVLMVAVFTTFFVGEHHLGVSGVLAVVVLGVALGKDREVIVGRLVDQRNHEWWEMVGFLSNSLIFAFSGLIIFRSFWKANSRDMGKAMGLLVCQYIILHVVRAVVVFSFKAGGLKRMGYGMGNKEALIMVYSGLRGAVGLALALEVTHDHGIPESVRDTVVLQVGGIVALTLLINGSTAGLFYELLDPYPAEEYRETLARRSLAMLDIEVHGKGSEHAKGGKGLCSGASLTASLETGVGVSGEAATVKFQTGMSTPPPAEGPPLRATISGTFEASASIAYASPSLSKAPLPVTTTNQAANERRLTQKHHLSQSNKTTVGLVHHLEESPFHGFADWPSVGRIVPDVTKLFRAGSVLLLDRKHPRVDPSRVTRVLQELEVRAFAEHHDAEADLMEDGLPLGTGGGGGGGGGGPAESQSEPACKEG